MDNSLARLDITQVFCDVDDFCQVFERHWQNQPQLPSIQGERRCRSRMSLSEVMTIVIAFHSSGYRTFKEFYTLRVLSHWQTAFPHLVSYTRFRRVNALVFDAVVLLQKSRWVVLSTAPLC